MPTKKAISAVEKRRLFSFSVDEQARQPSSYAAERDFPNSAA